MGGDALGPWWLAIAAGIGTTLLAAIGKLWSDNIAIRRELADSNAQLVHMQMESSKRSDEHQLEHRRDLRRLAGLSTSFDPPPLSPMSPYPPVVIREKPARARRTTKKPPEP